MTVLEHINGIVGQIESAGWSVKITRTAEYVEAVATNGEQIHRIKNDDKDVLAAVRELESRVQAHD